MASLTLGALPLFGILLTFTMPATTYDMKELETLTEGSNKFAVEIYQALKKPQENLIVSPISIQLVLALAYAGAKENTATEMAKTLHLPEKLDDVLKGHKMLIEQLQHPTLKLASQIFAEKTFNIKKEYQDVASKYFLSEVGLVNFISDPEGSRNEINQWVEEKTNKKIKDLLAEGTITPLTRLVLTNAIHFKANWAKPFDAELTSDEDFYVSPDNKVKVKMMSKTGQFPYKYNPELKAKILELPYEDKEFKMVIILPDLIDGLADVENKLSTLNLTEELLTLRESTVRVRLPKFKVEQTLDLKNTLIQLGIKDFFDQGKANLREISEEHLYGSKVVQKAFIEVDEKGTEAAAATAHCKLLRRRKPEPQREENFVADHPFTYIIMKNKALIFLGNFSSVE
ncbi:leukocyte elastase inhibitor-like isoform X4 [Rhodnius prolixus]|uniref:leukocyte elastase inhibitor-like isoform X4 n=1 Tax=Rhodnius prolixus TaxID=13249 RepID=UPI003D18E76B